MEKHYQVLVIGSGPAGQKAAIQAAKAGSQVAIVEQDRYLGGACVHRGTIPSKTLRENALRFSNLKKNAEVFLHVELGEHVEMSGLVNRLDAVLKAHDLYMKEQIKRNKVVHIHGRAHFANNKRLHVTYLNGRVETFTADHFIIATGSYPRQVDNVPVDHEHIYDSDSILSMHYLPRSLVVLGGGVIASEYASIFAALGVEVTMVDRYPQPLGFLDGDLTDKFIHHFTSIAGGRFVGNTQVKRVYWDGISQVITELENGEVLKSDKLLSAAGRIANVDGLALENAGLTLNERGLIDVDVCCRTAVSNIFAAGDVIGPPSLASASMEQGRLASRAALGLDGAAAKGLTGLIPAGIYAIPEISSVGMTEAQANEVHGSCMVGRAHFEEIARGQISDIQDGMLKMVADSQGEKLLGVQIVGEQATELIHIGQLGIINDMSIDAFVENIFNFPTLAEAYRVAALQITGLRAARQAG